MSAKNIYVLEQRGGGGWNLMKKKYIYICIHEEKSYFFFSLCPIRPRSFTWSLPIIKGLIAEANLFPLPIIIMLWLSETMVTRSLCLLSFAICLLGRWSSLLVWNMEMADEDIVYHKVSFQNTLWNVELLISKFGTKGKTKSVTNSHHNSS